MSRRSRDSTDLGKELRGAIECFGGRFQLPAPFQGRMYEVCMYHLVFGVCVKY